MASYYVNCRRCGRSTPKTATVDRLCMECRGQDRARQALRHLPADGHDWIEPVAPETAAADRALVDGYRARREAATVRTANADAGRGSCRVCGELIGNYHAIECSEAAGQLAAFDGSAR